ncbi:MAG: prepilin-type N-terminal cleavage/methylation domain-containing protein [Ferrovibrio sp.]
MRSAGFTLLEVLIALAIFAMAAQAVVWVFAEQSTGIARAERMQQATALARNTFERLGHDLPLRDGQQGGDGGNGLRWQMRISPYQAGTTSQEIPVRLYAVELAVRDERAERSLLQLNAIRLGPVQP